MIRMDVLLIYVVMDNEMKGCGSVVCVLMKMCRLMMMKMCRLVMNIEAQVKRLDDVEEKHKVKGRFDDEVDECVVCSTGQKCIVCVCW